MDRPKIVSPYGRPDDKFGYAVYSVVVKVSLAQQAAIEAVRLAVGNQRSMIPAHVTVKGTFCEPTSLDDVISRIRKVAAVTQPLRVVFANDRPKPRSSADGQAFATQAIQKSPPLVELHQRLYESIAPITTNAYGPEQGEDYRPHMTIYSEPLPHLADSCEALLDRLDVGTGYDCDATFLMGHIGPPYRGRWTVVREFPFGMGPSTNS